MGTHWYSAVKAESGYLVKCLPCGDVFAHAPNELEAAVAAAQVNKQIEDSFRMEGAANPATFGLAHRMRIAKRARKAR